MRGTPDNLPYARGIFQQQFFGPGQTATDGGARVQSARIRASLAANRELLALYWDIGRLILDRQKKEGWGAKVIDRLSADRLWYAAKEVELGWLRNVLAPE